MTTHNDDAVREVERQQRAARRHTTSTPRNDEPTTADLTRELHYTPIAGVTLALCPSCSAPSVTDDGWKARAEGAWAVRDRLAAENARLRAVIEDALGLIETASSRSRILRARDVLRDAITDDPQPASKAR